VLQVAGEGRDPDRGAVLLRPQRRWGEIAQRLADAGPGLGQDQARLVLVFARGEGEAGRGGVVGLLRSRLGAGAEQLDQPRARLDRFDRAIAWSRVGPRRFQTASARPSSGCG
jgi:hypothetical protein